MIALDFNKVLWHNENVIVAVVDISECCDAVGVIDQNKTQGNSMKTAIGLLLSLIITGSVFATGISVNFDGAKVVFLDENHSLNKVDDQGNVSPVLSPNVVVSNILLSAQGNLFVVLQSSQQFGDGNNYVLAYAVPTNNTISGIDTNLLWPQSIVWELGSGVSPALQSDAAGNLYYRTSNNYNFSLKKCVNGNGTNIVNLINDNILVCEWLVRPDGTILMGESVSEGLLYWKLVKLAPDNTRTELAANAETWFLLDFPDGNVYAGLLYNAPYFGVYKLPVALTNFDGYTPYIGSTIRNSPEYDVTALANGHNSTYVEPFISTCGSTIVKCVKTDDGRAIVLAGAQLTQKTIVQYYPIPEIIEPTLIDCPTLIEKMSNLLLIAGTKNGGNKLISYDPATSNETSLLNEDIEIYHLKPLYDGYIWFDGLKLDGNQYIVGKIQITTNSALSRAVKSVGSFQEMATLSGKPANLVDIVANPSPVIGPVIKANGQLDNVTINSSANLSITVQLNPGESVGTEVDWWIVARSGSTWIYMDSSAEWKLEGAWRPMYQGGLCNVPATQVWSYSLPVGSYTFYFAVDWPMDGILTEDAIQVDSVNVTVQ
ncbi:MAG: hypothetical protein NT011_12305 [Kiritimatiellaeota bacterium]|nr:hypothetical protein [Kiritimatiellota bacterium]